MHDCIPRSCCGRFSRLNLPKPHDRTVELFHHNPDSPALFHIHIIREIQYSDWTVGSKITRGTNAGNFEKFRPPRNKIACKHFIYRRLTLNFVVWGGIEPPTQGFSVLCSTD